MKLNELKKRLWALYSTSKMGDKETFSGIAAKGRFAHGNYVSVPMLREVCKFLDSKHPE